MVSGLGGVSSLHADAYNWTGWNALIGGRKLWRFWPPHTNSDGLYSSYNPKLGGIIGSITSKVNTFATLTPESRLEADIAKFPKFETIEPPMEVIQEAGEVVVIPSGWLHQVYHLSDTVALASQFASRYSLPIIIQAMLDYNRVTREGCLKHGDMPDLDIDAGERAYFNAAETLITTVTKCAENQLETDKHHPTTTIKTKPLNHKNEL